MRYHSPTSTSFAFRRSDYDDCLAVGATRHPSPCMLAELWERIECPQIASAKTSGTSIRTSPMHAEKKAMCP